MSSIIYEAAQTWMDKEVRCGRRCPDCHGSSCGITQGDYPEMFHLPEELAYYVYELRDEAMRKISEKMVEASKHEEEKLECEIDDRAILESWAAELEEILKEIDMERMTSANADGDIATEEKEYIDWCDAVVW